MLGARQPGWPLRLPPPDLVGTRPRQKRSLGIPNLLRLKRVLRTTRAQIDDDNVYIRVRSETMTPVDNGHAETVQHQVSQSAGPQDAARVFHSVPVQSPAPVSQHWRGESSYI